MGFNCKNNYFSISILTKILLHDKVQETIKECQHYHLTVIGDKVELSKSLFDNEVDEVKQIRIILIVGGFNFFGIFGFADYLLMS